MSAESNRLSRVSRVTIALILGIALSLGALVAGSTGDAGAETALKAKKRSKILGNVGKFPDARCPAECSGLAIVTGFQASVDGVPNSYRVPFTGHLTKWKIGLGKPTKSQRTFFESRFGSPPKAGISVLRPVKVQGKQRYKLMRRSPVIGLNRYLGQISTISLTKPIPVRKGDFVALTIPTWAPALAADFEMNDGKIVRDSKGNALPNPESTWRASRQRSTCLEAPSMENSAPQTEPGSRFEYGCRFDGQLLYRAKVVTRR
ncbi:MAG: hypothetical protein M3Y23_07085 [Actinomycetota bacterium]|nr:hypothetical protein [Actinomycetota bacterium]